MAGLADLPVHRQEALLWRYLIKHDDPGPALAVRTRSDVDAMVRQVKTKRCTSLLTELRPGGAPTAVRGSDGRFHLIVDGQVQCGRGKDSGDGVHRHTQGYFWWTDQRRYTIQAPAGAWQRIDDVMILVEGQRGEVEFTWDVTLTDEIVDPAKVRQRHRCPASSFGPWPAHLGDTPMGQMRARLVDAFRTQCQGCGTQFGTVVDHDHFTGYVRGLLCLHCNSHIDGCMHPAGCRWAEYLNNPPAAQWRVYYPKGRSPSEDSASTRAKIELWGFDPLFRNPRTQRGREPHRPAPAQATGLDLSEVTREALF
ncbi:endonuclease domain-containing protein [Catellatospora sp. NPDC049111]|uniref:endonuclease domain-containing protein n=1 Tax=Catellatospora sp. NPDC049111 TaxID=3155271 RepID=UPI0033F7202B